MANFSVLHPVVRMAEHCALPEMKRGIPFVSMVTGSLQNYILVFIVLALTGCGSRLQRHRDLLIGRPALSVAAPAGDEVQITYLGTNGYLIRSRETSIVVDPFFTRISLGKVIVNGRCSSSSDLVSKYTKVAAFPDKVDAWLVTHSHYDHLMDVPPLQRKYGGKIISSATGSFLSQAVDPDIKSSDLIAAVPGKSYQVGKTKIRVMTSKHDRVAGFIPIPGLISEPLSNAPSRPNDWKVGAPLAFLIEIAGKRIYVDSGGLPGHLPPVSGVDLAILGVAVGDGQRRFVETVQALKPRYILPSHQDNFFIPLDKGFRFSAISKFPKLKREFEDGDFAGELILMDYFQTWVLK